MSYSKNQKLAKDFLRWLHAKEQFELWFTAQRGFAQGLTKMWEAHAMWQQDPVMLPFRDAASKLRLFGYAGPANAKASEVYSKYIVIDTVRQGDPGHVGRGLGEVGRGRAEEDLRVTSARG